MLEFSVFIVSVALFRCAYLVMVSQNYSLIDTQNFGMLTTKLLRKASMADPLKSGRPYPFPQEERVLLTCLGGIPFLMTTLTVELPSHTDAYLAKVAPKDTDSLFPSHFRTGTSV